MVSIGIVFHSVTGTTEKLASAVADGVNAVGGCLAEILTINGSDIVEGRYVNQSLLDKLDGCNAVIFGSPTFMGGPSGQFKCFADATSDRWDAQRWEGKLSAGFTVGANPNGDQLATLQYFSILAAQHGMLWVGIDIPGGFDADGRNRLGAQLGLVSQSSGGFVHDMDMVTARYLGNRVALKALQITN